MIANLADSWLHYAMGGLVDGAIAYAVAWIFWRYFNRALLPGLGWWLFSLALLKCAIPLPYTLPSPIPKKVSAFIPAASSEMPLPRSRPKEAGIQAPLANPFPWKPICLSAYVLCALVGIARTARQFSHSSKLVARAREISPDEAMGVPAGIALRVTTELNSPAAWGFEKHTVILSERMLAGLTSEQLRWAIAHEVAHLRRGDGVLLLIIRLLRAVLFYHPIVWLAAHRIEALAEQECDRLATQFSDGDPGASARHLLAIAGQAVGTDSDARLLLAPGLSSAGRTLSQRIHALIESAKGNPLGIGGLAALVVAIAVMVPSFRQHSLTTELERRISQLEQQLVEKSVREKLAESNIDRAYVRRMQDHERLGVTRSRELEISYQTAKKITDSDAAIAAMKELIASFPKSNRAGCCALYIARLLPPGTRRVGWLNRCVDDWGDCYFLDGTSVGALSRKLQADALIAQGNRRAANALHAQITELYPRATNFGGVPL